MITKKVDWPKWKWWVPDDIDDICTIDVNELRCLVLPTAGGNLAIVWPDVVKDVSDKWIGTHDTSQFRDTAREAIGFAIDQEMEYGKDCLAFAEQLATKANETSGDRIDPPWYYTIDGTIGPSDGRPIESISPELGVAVPTGVGAALWFKNGMVPTMERKLTDTFSVRDGVAQWLSGPLFSTAMNAIHWLSEENVRIGRRSIADAVHARDFFAKMQEPPLPAFPQIVDSVFGAGA